MQQVRENFLRRRRAAVGRDFGLNNVQLNFQPVQLSNTGEPRATDGTALPSPYAFGDSRARQDYGVRQQARAPETQSGIRGSSPISPAASIEIEEDISQPVTHIADQGWARTTWPLPGEELLSNSIGSVPLPIDISHESQHQGATLAPVASSDESSIRPIRGRTTSQQPDSRSSETAAVDARNSRRLLPQLSTLVSSITHSAMLSARSMDEFLGWQQAHHRIRQIQESLNEETSVQLAQTQDGDSTVDSLDDEA